MVFVIFVSLKYETVISILGGGNIGDEIILTKRKPNIIAEECVCEITEYLNNNVRYNFGDVHPYSLCYIYDSRSIWGNTIVIRMPGSTIGCIQFDDENVITECCIYDDVISKSRCFSEDINERLKRFVGRTLKFQEE